MNKKSIAIVIPCWKRAEILKLTMLQLNQFIKYASEKVNVRVFYVFSEEDPEINQHLQNLKVCTHDICVVFAPNDQLGKKLNQGVSIAAKFGYHYLMNFGSDDLIHEKLIDLYMPFIEMNLPFFGLNSVWFQEGQADPIYFKSYNGKYLVGAGRMIHFDVVNKVMMHYGGLYPDEICRGMDTASAKRIINCGIHPVPIHTDEFPYIVDLKSEVNINSFEFIKSTIRNNIQITHSKRNILKEFNVFQQ
jgi:hypothetical protein